MKHTIEHLERENRLLKAENSLLDEYLRSALSLANTLAIEGEIDACTLDYLETQYLGAIRENLCEFRMTRRAKFPT